MRVVESVRSTSPEPLATDLQEPSRVPSLVTGRRLTKAEKARAKKAGKAEQEKQKKLLAEKVQEERRAKENLPAQSRLEAQRRNLPTYQGTSCKRGHIGIRLTRNGECYVCKHGKEPHNATAYACHSSDILEFSRRHGIPLDKFFDASGLRRADYASAMTAAGAIIAYNTKPCSKYGHTLRNKYGTCVVCDPKQLAFNSRAELSGWVYVAESKKGKFIKVGFTNEIGRRHSALISQPTCLWI